MSHPTSPAFPFPGFVHGHQTVAPKFGMTLREYAAIKIMAAIPPSGSSLQEDAEYAVERADVLIAELNKQ